MALIGRIAYDENGENLNYARLRAEDLERIHSFEDWFLRVKLNSARNCGIEERLLGSKGTRYNAGSNVVYFRARVAEGKESKVDTCDRLVNLILPQWVKNIPLSEEGVEITALDADSRSACLATRVVLRKISHEHWFPTTEGLFEYGEELGLMDRYEDRVRFALDDQIVRT